MPLYELNVTGIQSETAAEKISELIEASGWARKSMLTIRIDEEQCGAYPVCDQKEGPLPCPQCGAGPVWKCHHHGQVNSLGYVHKCDTDISDGIVKADYKASAAPT